MERDEQIYDSCSKMANSTEVNMGKPTELDCSTSASLTKTNLEAREGGEAIRLDATLPTDISVYRQDVVKCNKYESLQGVVLEVAGDSDSDESISDDDDSGEEEDRNDGGNGGGVDPGEVDDNSNADDADDALPEGQIRVAWTSGNESTENICDITVTDRSFLHGDIVASASNPTGQLGLVVDVDITVDLLSASGQLLKDISSRDIKRISEFSIGDFVVLGPWLGRVDEVLDNVTVLFDDGSVCKVAKADPLRLKPVLKPTLDDADCPYYPGQRVKAASSSVFKASRWLSGFWKANRLEGTVIRVQTASVVVYWIASAYLGVGTNSTTVPPEEQNPKNLTLLSCFSYANWQLCDWCLLPTSRQPLPSDINTLESGSATETIKGHDSIVEHVDSLGYLSDVSKSDTTIHDSSKSSVNSDALCHQASPEHMDGSESLLGTEAKGGSCKLHSTSNLNINKTSNSSENQVSDSTLPEQCSCSNSMSVSKDTTNESWPSYRKKLRKVLFKRDKKARKKDETFEKALLIVNTVTKVDVAWQDGNIERGLPSTSLIPIHSPNENEFFPEQYVVEKASNEDVSTDSNRVGIVRSVNARDRTVCVRWLKPVSRPEELREFDCEEVVSAYELDVHPDYDYCYGDVVVRLPSVSGDDGVSASNTKVKEKQDDLTGTQDLPRHKHKDKGKVEKDLNDESPENFTSLSWVGNITGLQDGDIEVTWADGMVSKVGPQEVFVVGRDDDGDSFDGGSEVSNGGASWETVDDNEMEALDVSDKEIDSQSCNESTTLGGGKSHTATEDVNDGQGRPLSIPLAAALGYVTRLATGLFSLSRNHSDSSGSDQIMENEAESQAGGEVSENSSEKVDNDDRDALMDELQDPHAENLATNVEETSNIGEAKPSMDDGTVVSCNVDVPHDFKHFDVAVNPSDHHFLNDSGQNNGGRKWVKKVQQEWNILEKNLPDDIYVRVFEDRMDLLRAVIVGAYGTPYQDGLFFFDFFLPPDYPQVPPTVYYHSGGLRINPNLYVDGKVCLSLLNTWTGKGNEVWDPSTSSILQVLVSLQGLVLNSKPYFNEAGYDKQIGTVEGEKNSLPYNENTYLLNLKSMIYLLRRPPRHFEKLVKDHFRTRGHYILKACEAYKEGSLIGSLTEDACSTEKSREHPCSVGFKLTLAKILPRLITAFSEVGVDCHQFDQMLNSGNIADS